MDPSHASTSATLLGRLRLNPPDPTAWEEFARRYGPVVHRWCRAWRLQDSDADDVTQTVLLTLVGRMREFEYDPAGSFRGWLKTVTYRAWARFLGDRERTGVGGDTVTEMLHSVEARDDLAARLEQEYDRELLDRAMLLVAQRVEPHTWEAFRLLAIEGLSGADAAGRLGIKVATTYVARSKVQKMIQEEIDLMDRPTA